MEEEQNACNKRKRDNQESWSAGLDVGSEADLKTSKVTNALCKYFYCRSPTSSEKHNVLLATPSSQTSKVSENKSTSKCNDSQPGEHTPHTNKTNDFKTALVSKAIPLSPVRIRDIPLPTLSWADTLELSLLMCFKEDIGFKDRDPDVFRRHPGLTPRMRAILFDWIMEVCEVYKLRRVTYYLAIDYVDRYLSRIDLLPKHQLQLLGITCLFIAAKVEEVYPPKLMELAYVTDGACTDQEMLLKEMAILKELKWDVNLITVTGWLHLYMQICYGTNNIRETVDRAKQNDEFIYPQFSTYAFMRASQLLDLCSLDDGMLQFQYSVIAASAIYYIFNRERALFVSGFNWEKIRDCVEWMAPFATVINRTRLTASVNLFKDYYRNGSGLKKLNPNIILEESHSIQTHSIELTMLEEVYKLIENNETHTATSSTCQEEVVSESVGSS